MQVTSSGRQASLLLAAGGPSPKAGGVGLLGVLHHAWFTMKATTVAKCLDAIAETGALRAV
eukprot:161433-Chlamydomonas_euryale.AAC.1